MDLYKQKQIAESLGIDFDDICLVKEDFKDS